MGQYSSDDLRSILESTDGRCHLCAKPLREANYAAEGDGGWEVDHSRAVANGGTDHGNNLRPACRSCNRSKGTRDAAAFRAETGLKRPLLSKSARDKKRAQHGAIGTLVGSVCWVAGPAAGAVGTVVGALVGAAFDPGDEP
jgi:5-methylcytosine-specific restriction endonuclease McrA